MEPLNRYLLRRFRRANQSGCSAVPGRYTLEVRTTLEMISAQISSFKKKSSSGLKNRLELLTCVLGNSMVQETSLHQFEMALTRQQSTISSTALTEYSKLLHAGD